MPQLILNQLRWLDHIVKGKVGHGSTVTLFCEELLSLFLIPGPLLSAVGSGECGPFRGAARDHYLPARDTGRCSTQ